MTVDLSSSLASTISLNSVNGVYPTLVSVSVSHKFFRPQKHPYTDITRHMLQYQCLHCGDAFDSDKRLRLKQRYCGYCMAVVFGAPDPSWLPSVRDRDDVDTLRKRGFQKSQ